LSDGWKKEIYQYIRFFHGALQLSNTINQENSAHSSAWAFWRRSPRHD